MGLKRRAERVMFCGAFPPVFEKAKMLRENMTEAEKILWQHLGNNKMEGFRFKAQHPIGKFIADFYCHKAKLVIEVDGKYHQETEQKEYDSSRSEAMEHFEIKIIRFTNEQIYYTIDLVLSEIKRKLYLLAPRAQKKLSPSGVGG